MNVGVIPGDGEAEAGEIVLVVDERIGFDEGWIVDGDAVGGGDDSSFAFLAAPAAIEFADYGEEFFCRSDPAVEDGFEDVEKWLHDCPPGFRGLETSSAGPAQ